MASNEVSEMFAKADIVKKLEEFRPGCDMGERVSYCHYGQAQLYCLATLSLIISDSDFLSDPIKCRTVHTVSDICILLIYNSY